jgi:hypothetical protein
MISKPASKDSAWKPSHVEEVICALWFICAFTALGAGCPKWVFMGLFIKAASDFCCAIHCAYQELREEEEATEREALIHANRELRTNNP